ncbi:hypothetical protein ACTQ33_16105 [Candidatus Avoscillospira sp. LCP25S3_F1]|uniref:hypothetical protein n=1 Tax=Candidatus Avoscillospira sp. LCP25S3_F1 TaxID=3438825 RepID=UPI003F8FBEC6
MAQPVYARLFDMDVDGTPELLLGNIDGFHDIKLYLYHWDHGGLSEISSAIGDDGGILADDFYLIQNPQNGTYGKVLRSAYSCGAFAGSRISLWTIPRFSG